MTALRLFSRRSRLRSTLSDLALIPSIWRSLVENERGNRAWEAKVAESAATRADQTQAAHHVDRDGCAA